MKVHRFLAAVACGLLPIWGFADSVTFYSGSTPTETTALRSGISVPLYLDKFDTQLGQLTGINLTLTYSVNDFGITFTNSSTTDKGYASYSFSSEVLGIDSSNPELAASLSGLTSSGALDTIIPTTNVTVSPNGTTPITFRDLTKTATGGIDAGAWALYEGSGKFDLSFTGLYSLTTTLKTGYTSVDGNTGGGSVRAAVTYTYQAIPEASTYALLLGAGTLGLVGWRRFRRK